MAGGITTAFWSMTINNYDDNDLALVRNGYADYCREIVHTLEEGEEGTPHIQAWIKLQRQQRLSFVKKLFPRGHFKPLTSDEYIQNTKLYAQKNDDTTRSVSVHKFNDPIPAVDTLLYRVCSQVVETVPAEVWSCDWNGEKAFEVMERVESSMVAKEARLEKLFVSPTYERMKKKFWYQIFVRVSKQLEDTHTHTHTPEKNNRDIGIQTDGEGSEERSVSEEEGSDGESPEGDSDSEGSSGSDEEDYESDD